jgi:hypothetical protein
LLSSEERYDLHFQLLASSLASLDSADIDCAAQSFVGSVKHYDETIDKTFDLLLRSRDAVNRRRMRQNSAEALISVERIENLRERELGLMAVLSNASLNIMRDHRRGIRKLREMQDVLDIIERLGRLAPRHAWNSLSVFSGLYWYLGRIDEALAASEAANDYLENSPSNEEMAQYARDQRSIAATEFIIFATTRARLLYEKGENDKKNKVKWHSEFRRVAKQIVKVTPNRIALGRIERARLYVLADADLLERPSEQAFRCITLAECQSRKPTSHILYGAIPDPALARERLRKRLRGARRGRVVRR